MITAPLSRRSPDAAWPLRTADGRTFAERKLNNQRPDAPREARENHNGNCR